jgi:hypothetical protein
MSWRWPAHDARGGLFPKLRRQRDPLHVLSSFWWGAQLFQLQVTVMELHGARRCYYIDLRHLPAGRQPSCFFGADMTWAIAGF